MDIIALTNCLQMDVDCIIYKDGNMPEVRHFSPDPDFPWNKTDLRKPENPTFRMHPKMTVLNYKDTHFNLVIEKESMIAKSGTLSFQRNLADKSMSNQTTKPKDSLETKSDKANSTEEETLTLRIKSLEEALTKSLAENQILKNKVSTMHNNDANGIHTNEVIKPCNECGLLLDSDDSLNTHIKSAHYQFSHTCQDCGKGFNQKANMMEHRKSHNRKDNAKIQCTMCHIQFQNEPQLINHNEKQHPQVHKNTSEGDKELKETIQFNCMECDHQTTNEHILAKHMRLAHNTSQSLAEYKCHSCAQEFLGMWNLRNHRRDAHGKSKVKCRYKADNTCKYGANEGKECWYDHSDGISTQNRRENTEKNKCKTCEEMFNSKTQLLTHRKEEHPETVPECKSIREGKECEYGDKCRFRHKELNIHMPAIHSSPNNSNSSVNAETQVFWKNQKLIKPPDHQQQGGQAQHQEKAQVQPQENPRIQQQEGAQVQQQERDLVQQQQGGEVQQQQGSSGQQHQGGQLQQEQGGQVQQLQMGQIMQMIQSMMKDIGQLKEQLNI